MKKSMNTELSDLINYYGKDVFYEGVNCNNPWTKYLNNKLNQYFRSDDFDVREHSMKYYQKAINILYNKEMPKYRALCDFSELILSRILASKEKF